jgi:hypothetical protein
MAFSMTDEELKTRIKNGTPIKILAELNGCSDQSLYNWMKKNGIQRPDKNDKPEKKPEQKPEADPFKVYGRQKVLEKIQGEISILEETIESLENALREHRAELEAWKELEAKYK